MIRFWNGFYKQAKKEKSFDLIGHWQDDSQKHQKVINAAKNQLEEDSANVDPISAGRDEPEMVYLRSYY